MSRPSGVTLRNGGPDDVGALSALEARADELYRAIGMTAMVDGRTPPVEPLAASLRLGRVLVAEDADGVAGFAQWDLVDSALHLGQLSVDPARQRRGLGRTLMDRTLGVARGLFAPAVTLTTFRDVPWNAPFYRALGFLAIEDVRLAPGLAAIRASERARGLDAIGPRLAMMRLV